MNEFMSSYVGEVKVQLMEGRTEFEKCPCGLRCMIKKCPNK